MVVQENKTKGEIKICVDLRKLNDASIHDSFLTPFTDEVLDNKGRKYTRDLRTRFTEDSSISQDMLEMAQECVEAMEKEVTGLRQRFTRTSQEVKVKL